MSEITMISKFNKWRDEQLTQIKERRILLKVRLRASVPKSLKAWLEEVGNIVIDHLFEYGEASRVYRHNHGGYYGFADLDEFEQQFEKLKTAWASSVSIRIDLDAKGRLVVFFTAL